jgi:hypothetical protein
VNPQSAIRNPQWTDTPEDLVALLLTTVRGQFCGDMTPGEWSMHSHFIRRNVILWPAGFMMGKGFTIPAARYEAIMRSIFQTIIHHGDTGVVKFWPGYLMKCVQDHWRHHWEEYYTEAKAIRAQVTTSLLACKQVEREDTTVETLAAAHRVLSTKQRHARKPRPAKQLAFPGV